LRDELLAQHARRPWAFGAGFLALFTLLSALALPGCGALALLGGLCFGPWLGTVLVAVGSTLGATASFLAARHVWRDTVQARWGHRLAGIEAGLARNGMFYLLVLRLAPVIPYAVLNPLMGLSAMPLGRFFGISLLGMLAGSAAYAVVGAALAPSLGAA
jgi:uncharacterized membrane protein YdjX (TVP38/TMEM64 family)